MWGYPPSPEDELSFLEKYRRILELRYKLLESELKSLDEKIKLVKDFLNEYPELRYRGMAEAWGYPPYYQVPSYEYQYPIMYPAYPLYPYTPSTYTQRKVPSLSGKARIIIATQGSKGLDDIVSPIFARSPFFTIIDLENGEVKNVETIENRFGMMSGGAGIAVAQYMRELNADVIIAGSFGPNSQGMLENMGIRTISMPPTPVRDILKNLRL